MNSRDYHLLVQNDTELGLTKTLATRVSDGLTSYHIYQRRFCHRHSRENIHSEK